MVQYRCLPRAARFYAAHESLPVSGYYGTDLLECGRNHFQDIPGEGKVQAGIPPRGVQPDELPDVGIAEHHDRECAFRALHHAGDYEPRSGDAVHAATDVLS